MMRVPYIANEVLWCTTVAQMELEQILQHMQGHNVFLIRTSKSQIRHTGVMPHAWWESPGATLPPGYESRRIPEIMEEAQAFFPTLSVCVFPSHQIGCFLTSHAGWDRGLATPVRCTTHAKG